MSFFRRLFARKAKPEFETPPPEFFSAEKLLQRLARPCWVPVCTGAEGVALASRFCGRAALLPDEGNAACGACSAIMPLFVQVNLGSLPSAALAQLPGPLRTGLLQLFYCASEDCNNTDFGPFAHNMLARIVPEANFAQLRVRGTIGLSPRLISDWRVHDDLPDDEEAVALGARLTIEQSDALDEEWFKKGLQFPVRGDKLLGWPAWVQSCWYPDCPICKTPMFHLFQIDSEVNVPFMFGDSGIGHVFACPQHPARAAFAWDCY